jgi:hypothetical protein
MKKSGDGWASPGRGQAWRDTEVRSSRFIVTPRDERGSRVALSAKAVSDVHGMYNGPGSEFGWDVSVCVIVSATDHRGQPERHLNGVGLSRHAKTTAELAVHQYLIAALLNHARTPLTSYITLARRGHKKKHVNKCLVLYESDAVTVTVEINVLYVLS